MINMANPFLHIEICRFRSTEYRERRDDDVMVYLMDVEPAFLASFREIEQKIKGSMVSIVYDPKVDEIALVRVLVPYPKGSAY